MLYAQCVAHVFTWVITQPWWCLTLPLDAPSLPQLCAPLNILYFQIQKNPPVTFGEQNPSHVNCICILVRHVSSTCVWLHFGILHSTPLLDLPFLAFCLGLNWIYWSMWESCHLDHTSFWIQDTLHFYIHSGLEFLSFRFCSFQLMNFGHLLSDLYLDIKFMLL